MCAVIAQKEHLSRLTSHILIIQKEEETIIKKDLHRPAANATTSRIVKKVGQPFQGGTIHALHILHIDYTH